MTKETRDFLNAVWFIVLFGLSKITYLLFVVISAGATCGLAIMAYQASGSKLAGIVIACFFLVLSQVALGWIKFFWNNVLDQEMKDQEKTE